MTGMSRYYISRALLSTSVGVFLALTGSLWWVAGFTGIIAFAFFLWAPHSGRYAVHPEFGVTALRRDERTQTINDKAARNAFVVTMMLVGGIIVYFGAITSASVPVAVLNRVLVFSVLTYFASDLWMRRTQG